MSNEDETYFWYDSQVTAGTVLFECFVCGAAVVDQEKHVAWHEGREVEQ